METVDLIYILGGGSKWNNNEIRYSLRSVDKYLQNFGKVYIVGELPDFLKDVVHIPYNDIYIGDPKWKERNIMRKIMRACQETALSDNFIFFNDDFFITQPIDASSYPYYHRESLEAFMIQRNRNDTYQISLRNTRDALKSINLTDKFFDIHAPIIYNKKKFWETMLRFDWTRPYGYTVKTLYGNAVNAEGEFMQDCKLDRTDMTYGTITTRIEGRHIFSIGDGCIGEPLIRKLNELYPEKSRWEK